MMTYRPWGTFKVVEVSPNYLVKIITVKPDHRLSLQYHKYRDEDWYILNGIATVTIDDEELDLGTGEFITVPAGTLHRIANNTDDDIEILEVQVATNGGVLSEEDIVRISDDYNRVPIKEVENASAKKKTGKEPKTSKKRIA